MRRIIGLGLTFLLVAFLSRAVVSADFVRANSNSSPIRWIHVSSKTGGIPAPGPSNEQTASLVLDVDKDGLNDFIIAAQEQG
ncbi:MAG: hypothetical protein ACREXR_15915, partial [Gammaproteobacteria bacterium]